MSFAALRQTVLKAHALSTDRFAETVELTDGGATRQVRAKITHEQSGPRMGMRAAAASDLRRGGTFDERERIEVTVSRDADWEYSLPQRPAPAAQLLRSSTLDADRRPFVFAGEVIFEGDQHAVYVFERPRRVVQGRGV